MESNFFRRLAHELEPRLAGARIDKVYGPAPDVWTFVLTAPTGREHLLLRAGKRPLLFLSPEKPGNPDEPAARVMWLRKHAAGRRLLAQVADWPGRRIAWRLAGAEESWLVLDLAQGPQVAAELPEGFGLEPQWPDLARALSDPEAWRDFPQLTPPLRRALDLADPEEAARLYARVRAAEPGPAWAAMEDDEPTACLAWPEASCREFPSALEAARFAGERLLFPGLAGDAELLAVRSRMRRVRRALRRLEREEEALRGRAGLRQQALALQGELYRLGAGNKLEWVELAGEKVELDPSLTVAGNMEEWFRKAAKAERGLAALASRRGELEAELAGLDAGERLAPPRQQRPSRAAKARRAKPEPPVHRFRTDDGFTVLRGRNAAANHKLSTRMAAPYDYWFHAQGGPGAHVVLKRDHPSQPVPESSLRQAAMLAGLKSWQSEAGKAEVMCALARDVRAVKGAKMGQVAVDAVYATYVVELDPGLEERLRVE